MCLRVLFNEIKKVGADSHSHQCLINYLNDTVTADVGVGGCESGGLVLLHVLLTDAHTHTHTHSRS